jgi:radical SAM superfamily enzyme YgiQ (UPF0313 family)
MIVLINPPSPFLINDKVHPPLGILYIAAHIQKFTSEEVQVIDLAGSSHWERNLRAIPKARIYGISATTPQYGFALKILQFLKHRYPRTHKIIGGPHASSKPEECLKDGWHTVVVGEGELVMNYIISNPRKFHGIIHGPVPDNLDLLPFPARHLIDLHSYRYKIGKRVATTMISSRGCPYNCSFCSKSVMAGPVRQRSAKNVIHELDEIQNTYGFNAVMFYDDIFVLNYPRLHEITNHMKDQDIIYRCFVRANLISAKMFDLLAETGCYEVGFGAESGSNEILKTIGKVTTVEQNTQLVRMAHERGIRVKAFLIAGLPGETESSLLATERWIQHAAPDDFDITILTPYPGSDIYDHPENYDIKFDKSNQDYEKWHYKGKPDHYSPVVATKSLSAEQIVQIRDEIERRWKPRKKQ